MATKIVKKTNSTGNFEQLGATANRLIYRSWGRDKTGKNHFGFTMPDPIFGQYLDPGGTEGVADKFMNDGEYGNKDIRGVHYRFNKARMDQSEAIEIRDKFIDDYEFALANSRSVQWDETEVWELFRWAEFGSESDAPKNYSGLNARYRMLIQAAYDASVNLQLIQKTREKWATNAVGKNLAPTGEFEPMGFKEANYITQANLEHSWNAEEGFAVKVVSCRQNMSIAGQVYQSLDFPTLAQLIFPNTEESDWV